MILDIWDKDKGTFGIVEGNEFISRATLNLKESSCIYIENKKIIYQTEYSKGHELTDAG